MDPQQQDPRRGESSPAELRPELPPDTETTMYLRLGDLLDQAFGQPGPVVPDTDPQVADRRAAVPPVHGLGGDRGPVDDPDATVQRPAIRPPEPDPDATAVRPALSPPRVLASDPDATVQRRAVTPRPRWDDRAEHQAAQVASPLAPAAADVPPPTQPEQPSVQPPRTSLMRNSALMAAGTMVSRVLGLVRTSLLAACIGIYAVSDAFTVANTLPNYVYILLSAGVLNAVLIPQITKAMKRPDGGQGFVDALLTVCVALLLVVTVGATVAAPWLLDLITKLNGADFGLAVLFGFICLPQIFFYGMYAVLGQILNTRGQFAAFMWTPVAANVIQIAGLVIFLRTWGLETDVRLWDASRIWLLAGSMTLGIVVQGMLLIVPLVRGGFRWRPSWRLRGQGLGGASRVLGWSFSALVIAQIGGLFVNWVMTAVANDHPGVAGVGAQANAFLIFMLPHSFITTSILTALYPQMSRAFQDGDVGEERRLLRRAMMLPAVGVIPMSIGMLVLAKPGVQVLFPSLSDREASDVAWILAAMALGVLGFGLTTLQQRFCFAREDGRTNLWLQVLLTAIQIGFAVVALLAVEPRWAVVTIGIGQTVANTVAAIAFVAVARRQLGGMRLSEVVWLYGRLVLASVIAGLAAGGVAWLMSKLGRSFGVSLLTLAAAGPVFVVAFWLMARALGIDELREIAAPVLRRLPGRLRTK